MNVREEYLAVEVQVFLHWHLVAEATHWTDVHYMENLGTVNVISVIWVG
jgi:hypothetical protein